MKVELAQKLYKSLRRLEDIGDNVEVYPAHGAGSLCGKSLSSKLSSTMGTEKMHNPTFRLHPEAAFVQSFLVGMPEAPDHFARCSEINRKGPATLLSLPKPVALDVEEFSRLAASGHVVVDTRDLFAFGAAHIPGAYALTLRGNFATFAGWVLPPDAPLLLVVNGQDDLRAALKGLYSVGLDRVTGYLQGGMNAWAASGSARGVLKSFPWRSCTSG